MPNSLGIPRELSLFVGAGISLPPPSSLPLFGALREAIASGLGVHSSRFLNLIAPEFLLSSLYRNGISVSEILLATLSVGEPNALHFSLAEAATAGVDVWTTNADELIEAAAVQRGYDLQKSYGKGAGRPADSVHLFKLHGTLNDIDSLAFRTEDVLTPISAELAAKLRQSFRDRDVMICGYAGADPDVMPALLSAFDDAASVEWFEIHPSVVHLKARYRSLLAEGKLKITTVPNPSLALYQRLTEYGLGRDTPSLMVSALDLVAPVRPDLRRWNLKTSHFAAGQLFEQIGKPNRGIARYRIGARYGSVRERLLCYRQFMSAGLYYKKPWARKTRSLIAFASRLPYSPWRQRLLSIHARLLEREGRYEEAYIAAERAFAEDRRVPDRMLDVCAASRKVGRLTRASILSEEAIRLLGAGTATQGKWMARALYEHTYALRLGGTYQKALTAVDKFLDLAVYGGPNWRAWALCQQGCVLCQATTNYDQTINVLLESRDLFLALGELQKAAAIESNLCTSFRAAGRPDEALKHLHAAESLWRRLSFQSILESEVIMFEAAELRRQAGERDLARPVYHQLATRAQLPIHRVLGLLGEGMIDWRDGNSATRVEQGLAMAQTIGFRPGIAYAVCWLRACGAVDAGQGEADLLDTKVFASELEERLLSWDAHNELPLLIPS